MRLLCSLAVVMGVTGSSVAAGPRDPLRFYPPETDVVLKVERPRTLVESVLNTELAKEAQELQTVRDFLDSANYRRFFGLLAHFEKELGAPWPALIDRVAGGGIAGGLKYAADGNSPVLVIVQGTDEATVERFFTLGIALLEEERSRQGATSSLKRKTYEGADCVEIDKDALVARAGDALLFSNKSSALKSGIEQWVAVGKDPKAKTVATVAARQAGSLLPPEPTAWLWVNLKPLKALPQAKDLVSTPRDNVILTILFAGLLDVARRSDFAAAGLYAEKGEYRLAVRMPAGREGMAADAELHLPRDPKVGGTLPLLEPQGVLLSHSFYYDLNTLYQKRDKIFPPMVAKDFANGEKQVSRFLIGSSLSEFLGQSGVHYRLVAARPEAVSEYKTQPEQKLPAFAVVLSMRDPGFARTMTAVIKAVALAAGQAASLRPWNEQLAGVPAFGYSFPEKGKFPDDPAGLRFNYQPTFGAYKDQYILASNKGLFRELVAILEKEDRSKPLPPNMQIRGYADGAARYAYVVQEQTLAQTILGQALKLGAARKEAEAIFKLIRKLGVVGAQTEYTANEFRLDLFWKARR